MASAEWTMKVARTELNETEYRLLARYAEEHKLTVKQALRLAAKRLVLDDKIYPRDPIFQNIEGSSRPGKKTSWSVDHDEMLYGAVQDLRLAKALRMIQEGRWTVRRGASFAGLTYHEMLDRMSETGVDSGPTLKELKESLDSR